MKHCFKKRGRYSTFRMGSERYAADKSYEGQQSANETNMAIANATNKTLIENNQQTNNTNLAIQRETNAANLALAEKQNQWNIEQWERSNEYNSPANQVKLYKEAGINPAAVAGNGWSSAQPLQSAPLANQEAAKMVQLNGLNTAHVENAEAGRAAIMAQRASDKFRAITTLGQNIANAGKAMSEMQVNMINSGQIPRMNDSQIKMNTAQTQYYITNRKVLEQKTPYEILNIMGNAAAAGANARKSMEEAKSEDVKRGYYKSMTDLNNFNYDLNKELRQTLINIKHKEFDKICAELYESRSRADLNWEQAGNLARQNQFADDHDNFDRQSVTQYKIAKEHNLNNMQLAAFNLGGKLAEHAGKFFGMPTSYSTQIGADLAVKTFNDVLRNYRDGKLDDYLPVVLPFVGQPFTGKSGKVYYFTPNGVKRRGYDIVDKFFYP